MDTISQTARSSEIMTNEIIPQDIRLEIDRRLSAIETDFGVKILFACESGSRAWGFASDDSDYDVRFIYIHPTDWYLTVDLEDKRDVIETPIDGVWDINGWELRKALKLFSKSNPPLLEWLQSSIIYQENTSVAEKMRQLLATHYSPNACLYHYLHMARKNYRTYLQGEEVWLKKYFYVLRPILACRWLERGFGVVPMEFERLVQQTDLSPVLQQAIAALLKEKRGGGELHTGQRITELSDFIETELQRFEKSGALRQKPATDIAALNQLFQNALQEIWI
jgi:predicted nucleotidyltransferase